MPALLATKYRLYIYINHFWFQLDILLVIKYEPNQPNCNKPQVFHKIIALRIFLHVVWLYVYMCSKYLLYVKNSTMFAYRIRNVIYVYMNVSYASRADSMTGKMVDVSLRLKGWIDRNRSVFAVDIIHKMKCFIAKQFQINQTHIDVLHRPCT